MAVNKILYFLDESCVPGITWQYLGVDSGPFVNLPDESAAMNRTFIFALIYAGLYAALICTALFSLIGINNSCLGRRSFPMFFLPWIIVCCAIVVMDVVATVYYVMDLVLTMVRTRVESQLISVFRISINKQRQIETEIS